MNGKVENVLSRYIPKAISWDPCTVPSNATLLLILFKVARDRPFGQDGWGYL